MVWAYFLAKQPVKAISLLEETMNTNASVLFGLANVPPPCTAVFTALITRFIRNDDIHSALSWFNRMLEQDTVAVRALEPLLHTPRTNQAAWEKMLPKLNHL